MKNNSLIKNWGEGWGQNAVINFLKIPLGNMCKKIVLVGFYYHLQKNMNKIVLRIAWYITDIGNTWNL